MTKDDIEPLQRKLEAEIEEDYKVTELEALSHCSSKTCDSQALDVLSSFAQSSAEKVISAWWQLAWTLVAKYSNGYVTTGENGAPDQLSPGYPAEWLSATDFAEFPAGTYYFPGQEPAWGVHLPEGGRPGGGKPIDGRPARWRMDGRSFGLGVLVVLAVEALVAAAVYAVYIWRKQHDRIEI